MIGASSSSPVDHRDSKTFFPTESGYGMMSQDVIDRLRSALTELSMPLHKKIAVLKGEYQGAKDSGNTELTKKIRRVAREDGGIVFDKASSTFESSFLEDFKKISNIDPVTIGEFVRSNKLSIRQQRELFKFVIDLHNKSNKDVDPACFEFISTWSANDVWKLLRVILDPKFCKVRTLNDILSKLSKRNKEFAESNIAEGFLRALKQNYPGAIVLAFQLFSWELYALEKFKIDNFVCLVILMENTSVANKDSCKAKFQSLLKKAKLEDPAIEEKLIQKYRETNPEFLIPYANQFLQLQTFEARLSLARLESNQSVVAEHFLQLFSDEEIQNNEELVNIFKMSRNHCNDEKTASYLEKTWLYITQIMNNPQKPSCNAASSDEPGDLPSMYQLLNRTVDSSGHAYRVFKFASMYDSKSSRPDIHPDRKTADKLISIKNSAIFPAATIEPDVHEQTFNRIAIQKLGYKLESGANGTFLTFPEPETLVARWNSLRKEKGFEDLEELTITTVNGTATVKEFNKALYVSDVVASIGEDEFEHDQLVHVLPTLLVKLNTAAAEYNSVREQTRTHHKIARRAIKEARNKISDQQHLRKLDLLEEITGVFADIYTAFPTIYERKEFIESLSELVAPETCGSVFRDNPENISIFNSINTEDWRGHFNRKFPEFHNFDIPQIKEFFRETIKKHL